MIYTHFDRTSVSWVYRCMFIIFCIYVNFNFKVACCTSVCFSFYVRICVDMIPIMDAVRYQHNTVQYDVYDNDKCGKYTGHGITHHISEIRISHPMCWCAILECMRYYTLQISAGCYYSYTCPKLHGGRARLIRCVNSAHNLISICLHIHVPNVLLV